MDQKLFDEAISAYYEFVVTEKKPRGDYVRTKKMKWRISIYKLEGTQYELIEGKDLEKTPK